MSDDEEAIRPEDDGESVLSPVLPPLPDASLPLTPALLASSLSTLMLGVDGISYGYGQCDLSKRSLRSVEGIQTSRCVRHVDLSHNVLRDVAPLAEVVSLMTLDLSDNQLLSIDPLVALPHLQYLDLSRSLIYYPNQSLEASFNCPSLRTLVLRGNGLRSLALTGMESLRELDVSNNAFQSITGIDASGLEILDAHANRLSSIEWMVEFSSLVQVDVSQNKISSLEPLASGEFSSLQIMKIGENPLASLWVFASLQHISSLRELSLKGEDSDTNRIQVLAALKDFVPGQNRLQLLDGEIVSSEEREEALEAFKAHEQERIAAENQGNADEEEE